MSSAQIISLPGAASEAVVNRSWKHIKLPQGVPRLRVKKSHYEARYRALKIVDDHIARLEQDIAFNLSIVESQRAALRELRDPARRRGYDLFQWERQILEEKNGH